jgi:glutathione S-transferase
MPTKYQHLGWIVSPYSQKTLAYLKFKRIPHQDRAPNVIELMLSIPKRVGKSIMPTLQTPEGNWWQDSSEIIDNLESRFPELSITPHGAKQKIAAHLLELHGDEWLVLSALHYRWSRPESADFIVDEFARLGVPFLPRFIGRLVGKHIRNMMKSYLPRFGIVGDVRQGLEIFTENLLAQLEVHFSQYSYLLGDRPCIGDFSMFGQIYAHLYRDPGSKPLFEDKPQLVSWINRMLDPDKTKKGNFLRDDEVPATLEPILQTLFSEQFEFSQNVVDSIQKYTDDNPQAKRVSRIIGESDFRIGGIVGKRSMFSFVQWKVQRAWDALHSLKGKEADDAKHWLHSINGDALINLNIRHRIKRENFREILEK